MSAVADSTSNSGLYEGAYPCCNSVRLSVHCLYLSVLCRSKQDELCLFRQPVYFTWFSKVSNGFSQGFYVSNGELSHLDGEYMYRHGW